MACNMRCRHCGSACSTRLPGELDEEEALALCDDLAAMGVWLVTLSGGEPLLRPDWDQIAKRLTGSGVKVNLLSNGWMIDEEVIDRAEEARLDGIGVSLDGVEDTHDFIRCPDAFRRVVAALGQLQSRQFFTSVSTTLMRRNLPELPRIKETLVDLGVGKWQLQIGSPMGNMADHKDEVIDPEDVLSILEFAHQVHEEGEIRVVLADCLGYFIDTSVELRQAEFGRGKYWPGCPAGRSALGIRHNGDLCGCNSLRDPRFIEGNLREHPLRELWTRPGAFSWNRERTRDSLTGFCRSCQFGDRCLAGCSSVRYETEEAAEEYRYCAHRLRMERLFPKIDAIRSLERLGERAKKAIELGLYELANRCLERALEMDPEDTLLLERAGYVAFWLGDWKRCRRLNELVLQRQPSNAYALKGLGLALVRLNYAEQGIATLRRSIQVRDADFLDPYYDLAIVMFEQERYEEAYSVLEEGRAVSEEFRNDTEDFHQVLRRQAEA